MKKNYMTTSDCYDEYLSSKIESLKQLIYERNLIYNHLIQKNSVNEAQSQKLLSKKQELEFIKDMLLKDCHKHTINAGKSKILMGHKLKQYHSRNESVNMQLQNLPCILKVKELSMTNEKLNVELVTLNDCLKNVTQEYAQLCLTAKSDFTNKVIEFSNEYLKILNMTEKLKYGKRKKKS